MIRNECLFITLAICICGRFCLGDQPQLALDRWSYIQIDDSRAKRVFGLAFHDFTKDGYVDIVSGPYFYRNPGSDMSGKWHRVTLPVDADALLTLDVDSDDNGDLIALAKTGKVYWLEVNDERGEAWTAKEVGHVGKTDHGISSQGYVVGQLVPGGKPEIVINVENVYYFEIPAHPKSDPWRRTRIAVDANPEGVAVGDIDGDGDVDVCGSGDVRNVVWWENPSHESSAWKTHSVGWLPDKYVDRIYATELNGDQRLDIVVSAANGSRDGVYWWAHPNKLTDTEWEMHTVVVQGTTNSLDVADMDGDGDIDLVPAEHRGEEKVAIWENDGIGRFTERVVSKGLESHLGSRLVDLDKDGDLDIVSIAWDDFKFAHLWRNDAVK